MTSKPKKRISLTELAIIVTPLAVIIIIAVLGFSTPGPPVTFESAEVLAREATAQSKWVTRDNQARREPVTINEYTITIRSFEGDIVTLVVDREVYEEVQVSSRVRAKFIPQRAIFAFGTKAGVGILVEPLSDTVSP